MTADEDWEEVAQFLSHPFAPWRTFLHPSQRKIAYRESYSGPAQVTGGPGTGKTVTAAAPGGLPGRTGSAGARPEPVRCW